MMYVLISFTFILGIFGQKFKDSIVIRRVTISLIFLILWVFLGWAYGAYDIMVGINRYVNYTRFTSFTEVGYNYIIVKAHDFGWNYRTFLSLCSLFELGCIFYFIKRNCKNYFLLFSLFIIYPLCIFFQYTRNLFAFSFILIGLDCIINKRKFYIIKYIICVCFASLFHMSSILFLLYLIFPFLKKKYIIAITIFLFALLFSASLIGPFRELVLTFLGQQKVDIISDIENAHGQFGRSVAIALNILMFWGVYFYSKSTNVIKNDYKTEFYCKMNIISFIFIPLSLNFGVGFSRFPILLSLVNYVFIIDTIIKIKDNKNRLFCGLILSFFVFSLIFIYYRNEEFINLVIKPFFEQNELIERLFGN